MVQSEHAAAGLPEATLKVKALEAAGPPHGPSDLLVSVFNGRRKIFVLSACLTSVVRRSGNALCKIRSMRQVSELLDEEND